MRKIKIYSLRRILASLVALFIGFSPVVPALAAAPFLASDVIGQLTSGNPDFTTYDTNDISVPNQLGLDTPQDVAVDPVAHKLFIADERNNRVIIHNLNTSNGVVDMVADNVLGQANFTSKTLATTQAGMNNPNGVEVDPARSLLFVADSDNHRVLVYDYATITNGENAINVIGQANFTTGTSALTQSRLNAPEALAYDSTNSYLYVGETGNDRIMVFDVASITDGENAVNVLGAPNFTTSGSAVTAADISNADGLAIDVTGRRLFASDEVVRRVLVYDITALSNGENAVNVLGAPDLTTAGTLGTTQSSTYGPKGLAYDAVTNYLYVASRNSRRIEVFDAASITNQENAIKVLGQPNFTASGYYSETGGTYPEGIALAGSYLYVANNNADYRIDVFDISTITDGEDMVTALGQTNGNGNPNFYTYGQNDQHPHSQGLSAPSDMVIDEAKHRLYIADQYNNRVVVHNLSTTNELIDYSADYVLGAPNMTDKECDMVNSIASADGMCDPTGLALDQINQRLFVADTAGSRVLVYDVTTITNGEDAQFVIGQPNFTSTVNALTAAGMKYPTDVEYDADRKLLFVSDYLENRVLIYDINSLATGMNASYVLGQPDFVTNNDGVTTQASLDRPVDSTYDPVTKYLYVSDETNSRVLVYDTTSLASGMNASFVLGQPNFTTGTWNNATSSTVATPGFSAIDPLSRTLYMWDYERILAFDISTITNNEAAIGVIGQVDLVTEDILTPSQTSVEGGYGLDFAARSAKLYASDIYYERLKVFDLARITTSSLPPAQSGEAYTKTLAYEDNQGTVSFSLISGSLPTGISLSSGGVLSGTPTQTGTFDITVLITDSNGTAGLLRTAKNLSLTVTNADADSDGIADAVEVAGPNGGDANGDGTIDSTQPGVSTTNNPVASGYTTVQASSGVIENYSVVAEADLPNQAAADFPLGLNEFAVSGLANGATTTITVYYDQQYDTSSWVFMKYNRETKQFADISSIVSYSTASIGGQTVTKASYQVTDGGEHDEDGIANGTVIDPAGPGFVLGATNATAPNTGFATRSDVVVYLAAGMISIGLFLLMKTRVSMHELSSK